MNTELTLFGKRISVVSRVRRRWLVVVIYTGFAAADILWFFQIRTLTPMAIIAAFLLLMVLTALVGTGAEGGDEREVHRRDHAYYVAHQPLAWVLLIALFAAGVRGLYPAFSVASPGLRAFLDQLPYAVLVAGGVLYATLPQAILLWTEPDMEEPNEN